MKILKGPVWLWIVIAIVITAGILMATGVIKMPTTKTTATDQQKPDAGGRVVNMKN